MTQKSRKGVIRKAERLLMCTSERRLGRTVRHSLEVLASITKVGKIGVAGKRILFILTVPYTCGKVLRVKHNRMKPGMTRLSANMYEVLRHRMLKAKTEIAIRAWPKSSFFVCFWS